VAAAAIQLRQGRRGWRFRAECSGLTVQGKLIRANLLGQSIQGCGFCLLRFRPIPSPSPNPIASRGRFLLADSTIRAGQDGLLLDILSGPQQSPVAAGLANPSLWAGMELVAALGGPTPTPGGLGTGFDHSGQGISPMERGSEPSLGFESAKGNWLRIRCLLVGGESLTWAPRAAMGGWLRSNSALEYGCLGCVVFRSRALFARLQSLPLF